MSKNTTQPLLVPTAKVFPSSLKANDEKGASYGTEYTGFFTPGSYMYNFLSNPTLTIILSEVGEKQTPVVGAECCLIHDNLGLRAVESHK